jgi:predicted O-methyltransferase YrrM
MEIWLDYEFQPSPRYGYGRDPHAALYEIINRKRGDFERLLETFTSFRDDFTLIAFEESPESPEKPYWDNGYFPGVDAASLHCMLCLQRPKTFCEIGSGHSTRFARNAVEHRGLDTRIISIDPRPRANVDAICDAVVRQPVEEMAPEFFDSLEPGDILFIDSSHRSFTNSDVTAIYLDILPRLRPGVLIHAHDIFLPYDYPPEWSDRFYNEQYLLACILMARQPAYEIQLANTFITYDAELAPAVSRLFEHPSMADAARHEWVSRLGWSFWMRKL